MLVGDFLQTWLFPHKMIAAQSAMILSLFLAKQIVPTGFAETAYSGSGNTHQPYSLADAQFVGGPSIFSFPPILNGVRTLKLKECCVMLQITIVTMEGGL